MKTCLLTLAALAALAISTAQAVYGQDGSFARPSLVADPAAPGYPPPFEAGHIPQPPAPPSWGSGPDGTLYGGCPPGGCSGCQQCSSPLCEPCDEDGGFFLGVEFLLVRPHFSEGIAFAQINQGLAVPPAFSTVSVEGQELQFDYEGSPRVFAGYQFGSSEEVRLTYWHFRGDTEVDGASSGAGNFIVDPFGGLVGTRIDPVLGPVTGGVRIDTEAWTEMDVLDLEFMKPIRAAGSRWQIEWSAGARVARVEQYYDSLISNADGSLFSFGDFNVDFLGAGPRVGLHGQCHFDQNNRFGVFAKTNGSLLVGQYDVSSSTTSTDPFPLRAGQTQSLTRTIPVFETELGTQWKVSDSFSFSAGWLFQAWFDLGTSGGNFGGFFSGADDSNISSFDGLFLRGELGF